MDLATPQLLRTRTGVRAIIYLLAIALPIMTIASRLVWPGWLPLSEGPCLVMFILPITICAFIGGFGPGALATALSSITAYQLLFPNKNLTLFNQTSSLTYLTIFTASGLAISFFSHRMQATRQRRYSDQQRLSLLAQLIDSTDDSVIATRLDGQITHWNRGAEKIFGYSAQEALGQPISILFTKGSLSTELAIEQRIINGEPEQPYHARRRHRDGHTVDISTTVSAIRDHKGRVTGISRISGDISQQKRIEHARLQAEAKFRALVEQSLTGVYILQDLKIVYANQAAATLFGYNVPQELEQQDALGMVRQEDRARVAANISHRLPGQNESLRYRFAITRPNGEHVVVEVHGRHFMHEGRSAIIGSMLDVTDAQKLQEEMERQVAEKTALLHQKERELHTILDNMPAQISYYDKELRHRFGNLSYCNWHHITAEELQGLPLDQLISRERYANVQDKLESALQGQRLTFELHLKDDEEHPDWHAQVHLIPDLQDGQVKGLFALMRDITPIKQAEQAMRESEARFRQLFESAPVGIALYHVNGNCIMVNQAHASLIGGTREQLLEQNFYQLLSWKRSGLLHSAQRALQTGLPQRMECRVDTTFGQKIEVECEFTLPEIGGSRYLMMLAKDISPYRQAATLMKQAMDAELDKARLDQQYRQVIENMADGFFATDLQGRLLEVNDVYARLSGFSREELLEMRFHNLVMAETREENSNRLQRIADKGCERFEIMLRRKHSAAWPSDISASFSADNGGRIYAFIRDISEKKQAEDEIRRLAFYDSLTRLPNRQLLMDRLNQALIHCQRNQRHGALLFLDLDNFKLLNDTLGHDMGDRLLISVAQRLKTCVRSRDSVARLGGDEFVIMLEDLDREREPAANQIRNVASIIMEALNHPYTLDQTEYHNTPSIGVTLFCQQQTSVEELLKQADLAMYQAKAAGRNTVCFFDPATQQAVEHRRTQEAELRNALRQDHLILHYQPQVDGQGRTIGAEALVRWQHPEQGMITPGQFIALAEESGLVYPLGLRVLELACQQLAIWRTQDEHAHLALSVNVSARQFRHSDFVAQINALLTRFQIRPQHLKLELTESLLIHDIEDSARKMETLRDMGVKFSLDDFGTGYSSLAYLKSLPLEQLKIDQSFVRDILTDANDAAIVRAIIVMGHSLGLKIVAEGVETEEQWAMLMKEGCDIGQGYFFSRPVPVPEFESGIRGSQKNQIS
jgi:diguanylate cyclase (GGDEF)-like protein/PAS domain S-box-containing protein